MDKQLRQRIRLVLEAAEDKKGENPAALDVSGLSSVTDAFIIVSGNSDTHVRAVAEGIEAKLAQIGIEPLGKEGYNDGTWILLDYVDLVVHIFHKEKRMFYNLETLWSDAPRLRPARKGTAAATKKRGLVK